MRLLLVVLDRVVRLFFLRVLFFLFLQIVVVWFVRGCMHACLFAFSCAFCVFRTLGCGIFGVLSLESHLLGFVCVARRRLIFVEQKSFQRQSFCMVVESSKS